MALRGKPLASFFMLLLIGLIGFFNVMQKPRFQAFHNVDVLQLIATGMCFGVALTLLFATFRRAA
ncbi:MAG TPA: hypothetical protein VOA41_08340 [Candidatus Dormibacteraeota bacterium]|nr:hypothetical protein [Candidatus Dormibacteraeota bacterium]